MLTSLTWLASLSADRAGSLRVAINKSLCPCENIFCFELHTPNACG
jgi:hypothetical protein